MNTYKLEAIYQTLLKKYGKSAIGKKELAYELNIGVSTLSKRMTEGMNLPNYRKIGDAKNARVIFPIIDVAEFLSDTVKVA